MNGVLRLIAVALLTAWCGPALAQDAVRLTGRALTIEDVVRVARQGAPVEIAPEARATAARAFRILLAAAGSGMPIYGLNRGVGPMRETTVLRGETIDLELRARSEAFNLSLLLGHDLGTGPEAPRDVVRATMLARLNTALLGGTGLQPVILDMFAAFLNRGITPVLRTRGSIGEGDIYILPTIGLAMMGIGEVVVAGERMPAAAALRRAGLEPIRPWAKDALGLLSSNAFAAGQAALVAAEAGRLLDRADEVFGLSLEGLNGNVAPLLDGPLALRPFQGTRAAAARLRELLAGSYLWQPDPARFIQDPLSFRRTAALHGAARDQLASLVAKLEIQLNASDDNPVVLVDTVPAADASPVERSYFVSGRIEGEAVQGAVVPSAHFEPVIWALDVQALGHALAQVGWTAMQRGNRLASEAHTNLPGPLHVTGLPTISDSLMAELTSLTMPVSTQVTPSSRDIEDIGTNAPLLVRRAGEIVDLAFRILSIEAVIGAQLVDLRRAARPGLPLGAGTSRWRDELRRTVPFLTGSGTARAAIDDAYRELRGPPPSEAEGHSFGLR